MSCLLDIYSSLNSYCIDEIKEMDIYIYSTSFNYDAAFFFFEMGNAAAF